MTAFPGDIAFLKAPLRGRSLASMPNDRAWRILDAGKGRRNVNEKDDARPAGVL